MNGLPGSGDELIGHMALAPMAHIVPDTTGEVADDSVSAIVARVARGDTGALTTVYRQHHVAVRAFAQRLVGDIEAAEDLVQDVFVALPSAAARFRGESALRTFLVSIAVNHAKNHVRAAARRRAAMTRLGREPEPTGPRDPEHVAQNRQLADRLMLALDALPLDQRVAIVLSEIEERTSSEIATIVSAPEGTVRTRVFHAKKKLRELLGAFSEQGGER